MPAATADLPFSGLVCVRVGFVCSLACFLFAVERTFRVPFGTNGSSAVVWKRFFSCLLTFVQPPKKEALSVRVCAQVEAALAKRPLAVDAELCRLADPRDSLQDSSLEICLRRSLYRSNSLAVRR